MATLKNRLMSLRRSVPRYQHDENIGGGTILRLTYDGDGDPTYKMEVRQAKMFSIKVIYTIESNSLNDFLFQLSEFNFSIYCGDDYPEW